MYSGRGQVLLSRPLTVFVIYKVGKDNCILLLNVIGLGSLVKRPEKGAVMNS